MPIIMKKVLAALFAVALGLNADAQSGCLNSQDANGDGLIGVDDLMDLLSHWGDTDFDFDGVYDSVDLCTDEDACNYVLKPTEPCEYLDALGVCGGGCPLDLDGDGVCDEVFGACEGLESFTFDGYAYDLVAIGDQCWFAENLRTEHYANGDAIPANLNDGEWNSTNSGAVAVYGEDAGCTAFSPDGDACDPTWSLNEYGRLYNYYAVYDERGLCPTGWHVPTDGEWMTLEMELGMSASDANVTGWRGTDQGTQMKTTYGWSNGGNGSNSIGFSGLPGGYRLPNGNFYDAGFEGKWWSSVQEPNMYGWFRYLNSAYPNVFRSWINSRYGFSVRCVRD
jgi:uncharacterized protein (TIGR02145 family)